MGCWQETCALTHLPIYENDPCVMVVMDEIFTQQLDKNPELGRFNSDQGFKHIEAIHRGKYNEYGWIKKVKNPEAPDEDGVKRHLSHRRVTIFFHERVWDEAVKAGMKKAKQWEEYRIKEAESHAEIWKEVTKDRPDLLKENPFALKSPTKEMVELRAVHEVAYWSRRDLMLSHYFHGAQAWENHYYDLVHKLTKETWDEIQKKQEEDE